MNSGEPIIDSPNLPTAPLGAADIIDQLNATTQQDERAKRERQWHDGHG